MFSRTCASSAVVSPKIYAQILTSRRLSRRLIPEGLSASPYEILDYRATLTLLDQTGRRATFHRTQGVRFLQNGVSAILDHFWGDGVPMTSYHHTAGQLAASLQDGGRRHLVIDLGRPMHRGETLSFDIERTAMVAFTEGSEWLETTIDHPIHQLGQQIIFPVERPCQSAELIVSDFILPLRPLDSEGGRTMLRFEIPRPEADTPYLVRWRW